MPIVLVWRLSWAWCELFNFTADCVCMVAASQSYDPDGYAKSYEEYLRLRREGKF